MAITNFIPALWAAGIQVPYQAQLVYAQPAVANTDYEGEIKAQGDTVHITGVNTPTIRDYVKSTDLTTEEVTDSRVSLLIDQGKYFSFAVNDVDAHQAAGNFESSTLQQAGHGLADEADKYIASLFNLTATNGGPVAGNRLGNVSVINGAGTGRPGASQTTAYSVLVSLGNRLTKANVPHPGRYAVIDPDFLSALQHDSRFSRVDASGSSETLRNGLVGRAAGFDILVSNNTVKGSGRSLVTAGVPGAITYASQILEVEALRSQSRFADIVRGLHVYGAKIVRPAGVATANVEYVEGTGVDTVVVQGS